MVSWRRVCRPKQLGGLGIIDLHKHGIAPRLRWEWLRRTDPSRPWQGLNLTADKQVALAFRSLVQWRVGNGEHALFWRDRWLNGGTIAEIAPLVAARVRTQVANKRLVREGLCLHAWTDDLTGILDTDALA